MLFDVYSGIFFDVDTMIGYSEFQTLINIL